MTTGSRERRYGQYCGLAHAASIVGERWALLIVRDLMVGPRRFGDLQRGLPRITTSVLTTRLKELEAAGVIERRALPSPERGFAYSLTPYGQDLEDSLIALGRWGARSMPEPRPDDVVTPDLLTMALRTTFRADAVRRPRTWVLDLGEFALTARTSAGGCVVTPGRAGDPDLVVSAGPALRPLMARELDPDEALRAGDLSIEGSRSRLDEFLELFRIQPLPA